MVAPWLHLFILLSFFLFFLIIIILQLFLRSSQRSFQSEVEEAGFKGVKLRC